MRLSLKEGDRVKHLHDGATGTVQAFWVVWDDHEAKPLETGPFGESVLAPLDAESTQVTDAIDVMERMKRMAERAARYAEEYAGEPDDSLRFYSQAYDLFHAALPCIEAALGAQVILREGTKPNDTLG